MRPKHGKLYKMTKREAKLLAHVVANFRDVPFTDEELAASLGWPVHEVRAALETCTAFGLMGTPGDDPMRDIGVMGVGEKVSFRDLLSPEEEEEAKKTAVARKHGGPDSAEAGDYVSLESLPKGWELIAPSLVEIAVNAGMKKADIRELIEGLQTRAEAQRGRPEGRWWYESHLSELARAAEAKPHGDVLAREIRRRLAALEAQFAALDAIGEELEALGWAWKLENGRWYFPWQIGEAAARERSRSRNRNKPLEINALMQCLHRHLRESCAQSLAELGCPPELVEQLAERERHLLEDVLFGPDRLARPIPYPEIPGPLRRLVNVIDGLPGLCVVGWYPREADIDPARPNDVSDFEIRARVLEDGQETASRLQAWGLEHSSDRVQLTAATHSDGRREVTLQGKADPEKVADWLVPLRDRPVGASPDPDVAARREAGWKALRIDGWLTSEEVTEAFGIETNDPEVVQFVMKEIGARSVSCGDLQPLFDPKSLTEAVARDAGHAIRHRVDISFAGRFREVDPFSSIGLGLVLMRSLFKLGEAGHAETLGGRARQEFGTLVEQAEQRRLQRRKDPPGDAGP